ncbi:MAG: transglutaminase-like domain-containing protein [Hyphomicrobium sp.]
MHTRELAYYASHSALTDPGTHADLFRDAPYDEAALARWVRNVHFHETYAMEAGLDLPPKANGDPAISDPAVRFMEAMLGRILARDPRPLAMARPKERCFIGTCRDYALMLCALLRHQGRAARLRCGFAFYYEPDSSFAVDHWVTEVWDRDHQRWRLVDAEVDPDLPQHRVITVDPFDVPRDQFQTAATAWRLHRGRTGKAGRYGISGLGERGEWFMAANVLRDLAALNKREITVFDYWGIGTEMCLHGAVSDEHRRVIDGLAAVTADDAWNFAALRRAYEEIPAVRVSDPIKSWPKGVETDFNLNLR